MFEPIKVLPKFARRMLFAAVLFAAPAVQAAPEGASNASVQPGGSGPAAPTLVLDPVTLSFELVGGQDDTRVLTLGNPGGAELVWNINQAAGARTGDMMAAHGGNAPGRGAPAEFEEGFESISQLAGRGWALINNSQPLGATNWFQGHASIFPAQDGGPNSYITGAYHNTASGGTISNWLITPEVELFNGTRLRFWTRTLPGSGSPDRLELRLSTAGGSVDVGDSAQSVGVFTERLLSVNEHLVNGGYPPEWAEFVVTVSGLDAPTSGRFALRYFVTDAGPSSPNSNWIGIDTVSVSQPCTHLEDIPWLSVMPDTGIIPPGDDSAVTVTVDTTDLAAGEYAAQLCVASNYPAMPLVAVPVALAVAEPMPELSLLPDAIDFGEVSIHAPGEPVAITLHNTGHAEATGLQFVADNAAFSTGGPGDDCASSLPAGQSCQFSIVFAPATTGAAAGTVDVSGDQDVLVSVAVQGVGTDPLAPVLDLDAPPLDFDVVAGQGGTRNLTINNLGLSDLVWAFATTVPAAPAGAPAGVTILTEGFEAGTLPPPGWSRIRNNSDASWSNQWGGAHSGNRFAYIVVAGNLQLQDEWLLSPPLLLTEGELSFWSTGNPFFCRDTNDNCDLNVWLVRGEPGDGDDIFVGRADEDWTAAHTWSPSVFDLTGLLPAGPVRIGFQYLGTNGAEIGLDSITLTGSGCGQATAVPWLSVTPASGATPPEQGATVSVDVDASALAAGEYTAALCLLTNDPDAPWVLLPVNLNVAPAPTPALALDPPSMTFDLISGQAADAELTIGNSGEADLVWNTAQAGAGSRGGPLTGDWQEGFNDISQLPGAGWALINNSQPQGTHGWSHGSVLVPPHQGPPGAYITADYRSTTGGDGVISNWLITPEVALANGTELSFWTRTLPESDYPDRLEVRMSTAGDSTDIGDTATSVGDFDTLLLSINPHLEVLGYPGNWTEFRLAVSGLETPTSGRFAFRYFVTEAGPQGVNSQWIALDTVGVSQPGACVAPSEVTWLSAAPPSGVTAPGDTSLLQVTVDTGGLAAGQHVAHLCLFSNDPDTPTAGVPVTVNVQTVPVPQLAFEPSSLDFGSVTLGATGPVLTATLLNTGDGDATDLSLVPPGDGFVADLADCGTTLAAGQECPVTVTFTPSVPGLVTRIMSVESQGGAAAFLQVRGSGMPPPQDGIFGDRFEPGE